MRIRILASAALSLACLAGVGRADVKLPAIFGDHMVLQRDQKVPVWGWADPGEDVTVTVQGQAAKATAGDDRKWQLAIEPLRAGDQPIELTVQGKNTITIKDVLVGDVWVASGQSNMEWAVRSAHNAATEVPAAQHPQIRLFIVPKKVAVEPQTDVAAHQTLGKWEICGPDTVAKFSAVGYFFAREIQQTQKVPVGMIGTYWGGTPAQSWTSIEKLESVPETKGYVNSFNDVKDPAKVQERFAKATARWEQDKAKWDKEVGEPFKKTLAAWQKEADAARAAGKEAPARPRPARAQPRKPVKASESPHLPSSLYNGMIAPIIPFAIKGAIWYQGESNAGQAVQYQKLFPAMIEDWRARWGQGPFPFLWVQLANYKKRQSAPTQTVSDWPGLREAQSMTLKLPATGQAVIIDIGEEKDIHPRNKLDVGKRLALAARKVAYGEDIVYSGPTYDALKIEGDKARVTFKNTGSGLALLGAPTTRMSDPPNPTPTELKGFAIAGEDRRFVWATATIDGDSVIVSSPEVKAPVAVRYAWANNPEANLYNQEGLPASPFRSDDWQDAPKPPAAK